MNLRRITARAAVAGATTALIAGGLVAATGTAANAETGTASYNCTNPYSADVLPVILAVGADLSTLPALPTGFAAPAGALPVQVSITIPEVAVQGLKANGITAVGAESDTFALPFGTTSVPLSGVAMPMTDLPATGDLVLSADATNGEFQLPDPGNIPVKMPASFTADAATNLITLPLTCTISGDQPTITSLTVIRQGSTLSAAKTELQIKKGKIAKIVATVTGANVPATGRVVAKEGKKTLGSAPIKNGKAALPIRGLKPGVHNVTLSYAGDKRTLASNTAGVVVTVTK